MQLPCIVARLLPLAFGDWSAGAPGPEGCPASSAMSSSGSDADLASFGRRRRALTSTRGGSSSAGDGGTQQYYEGYSLPDGDELSYSVYDARGAQRARYIGARNRVLSGMLLHQVRAGDLGGHGGGGGSGSARV